MIQKILSKNIRYEFERNERLLMVMQPSIGVQIHRVEERLLMVLQPSTDVNKARAIRMFE